MTYRWIGTSEELAEYVARLLGEPRYAMDTEFHRERTYFPKLALVQIAGAGEIVLIDPLACDLSPLKQLFASDSVAVLHAAQQDHHEPVDRDGGRSGGHLVSLGSGPALHRDGVWLGISRLRTIGWSLRIVAPDPIRLRDVLTELRAILRRTYPRLGCGLRRP